MVGAWGLCGGPETGEGTLVGMGTGRQGVAREGAGVVPLPCTQEILIDDGSVLICMGPSTSLPRPSCGSTNRLRRKIIPERWFSAVDRPGTNTVGVDGFSTPMSNQHDTSRIRSVEKIAISRHMGYMVVRHDSIDREGSCEKIQNTHIAIARAPKD